MTHPAIDNTTIKLFLKGKWDNFLNHNPAFKIMQERGNIITGRSGTSVDWVVRAGRYAPSRRSDFEDNAADFTRTTLDVRMNLDWGSQVVRDVVDKREFKKQGEETALLNLQQVRLPQMARDLIDDGIGYDLVRTGSGTEAMLGLPVIHQTYTNGGDKSNKEASATLAAGGTYAGQSMALNGITGVDNAEDDAWTPLLVNTEATWQSGGTGFDKTNAVEILQYALNHAMFGSMAEERLDGFLLPRDKFLIAKLAIAEKQRIWVDPGKTAERYGLGNKVDIYDIDGAFVMFDQHLDGTSLNSKTIGYGINCDKMYLDIMDVGPEISADKVPGGKKLGKDAPSNMFDVECTYDPYRRGALIDAEVVGQFRFSPRHQVAIADFETA